MQTYTQITASFSNDMDEIDRSFKSLMPHANWRSPARDNEFNKHSHYIVINGATAYRACRTISGVESFDVNQDADFKSYPQCKECQKHIIRLKEMD